jgi:hypothetical protein
MVTQNRRLLSVAVTALVSMTLIGSAEAVTLRKPVANAVIAQNDPTIGCPSDPTHGSGYKLKFTWAPPTVRNFSHWHLVVQHGASTPIVDADLRQHRFVSVNCSNFVIDSNLSGWHWQVTRLDANGKVLETSELRSFSFAPCRVNAQVCSSPAP